MVPPEATMLDHERHLRVAFAVARRSRARGKLSEDELRVRGADPFERVNAAQRLQRLTLWNSRGGQERFHSFSYLDRRLSLQYLAQGRLGLLSEFG